MHSIFFRSDPLIAFPFFDTSTLLNGFFFYTRKRLIMRMKYIIRSMVMYKFEKGYIREECWQIKKTEK